ncbi:MAG: hypothetical protein NTU91_03260 [Chloroflexi bacterium]|nr:hypothetical protein [Chloroflexota bacterium]
MRSTVSGACLALPALAIGLAGCGAGWHRTQPSLGPLPVRQQVQVWHGGLVERWHAVMLSPDSVSGVPFLRPANCDSCRLAVSRADVDSVRAGHPVLGYWKTAALVVATPIGVIYAVCILSGHYPSCFPEPT